MKTMAKAHRNRSSVNGFHFFKKLKRVSRRGTRIPVEQSYAILTGLEAGKSLWGIKPMFYLSARLSGMWISSDWRHWGSALPLRSAALLRGRGPFWEIFRFPRKQL